MNDVLLINPPMWSPSAQSSFSGLCPPLGLGYLAAVLLEEGISVEVLDLSIVECPDKVLKQAFDRGAPRLVGITSLTQNFFHALRLSRQIKELDARTTIAIGGPHVTYQWKAALAEPSIDIVARFEAERSIVEIYHRLRERNHDFSGIEGIAFRDGGKVTLNSDRPYETDLDRIPFPARHLLSMSSYARPGTIMTSRGCPQKCIFCISSTYEGGYRPRSAENVLKELEVMRRTWGLRELYFIDNVFTVNAERVRTICQGIIDRQLDIQFECVSRADFVTEELVGWLKAAGCRRVEIGVESGNQKIIDKLKKCITLDQVVQAAGIVLRAGIVPMFTFQIGSPFDTPATLEQTHELAAFLRSKGAITFFSVMTPFPGTPFAEQAAALNVKIRATDWQDYRTSNPICDMQHLDRNRLRQALWRETAAQAMEARGIWPGNVT